MDVICVCASMCNHLKKAILCFYYISSYQYKCFPLEKKCMFHFTNTEWHGMNVCGSAEFSLCSTSARIWLLDLFKTWQIDTSSLVGHCVRRKTYQW